jgi:hypothetical protein
MAAATSAAAALSVEDDILRILNTKGAMTALQMSRALGGNIEKTVVNRQLYSMLDEKKVSHDTSIPPVWRVLGPQQKAAESTPTETIPLAVVDLGNVHDVLRELVPYARSGLAQVEAFADRAYNGFGIRPALDDVPGVRVHRARGTDRNAADIELVWFLCETLPDVTHAPEQARQVVVATKDQGFQSLRDLVQRRGHTLTFVTQWSEMREFIE